MRVQLPVILVALTEWRTMPAHRVGKEHVRQVVVAASQPLPARSPSLYAVLIEVLQTGGAPSAAAQFRTARPPSRGRRRASAPFRPQRARRRLPASRSRAAGRLPCRRNRRAGACLRSPLRWAGSCWPRSGRAQVRGIEQPIIAPLVFEDLHPGILRRREFLAVCSLQVSITFSMAAAGESSAGSCCDRAKKRTTRLVPRALPILEQRVLRRVARRGVETVSAAKSLVKNEGVRYTPEFFRRLPTLVAGAER